MEKNLTVRIFKIISLVLILAAVVSIIFVWAKGDDAIRDSLGLQNMLLNPYFFTAYIALGLCIILSLLFPIINIISQPKNALRVLIGLGAVIVIGIIAYAIAGNELTEHELRTLKITEAGSRRVGAALIGTYAIAIVSVLAVLYAEVMNFIKK